MSTPVLDVRGLTVALPAGADRERAALDVSLTVDRGEIVCLVGESGSGKSVIAHTIMGLLPKGLAATGGEVRLTGENLLAVDEARLRALRCTRMSMIFQEPMTALNPVMRCGDQIDEVLATHTTLHAGARREKVLDIVRAVQLAEPERMLASFPHQLSGGQRQRIMIAMALVLEPALLIADEPTTALDVTTQAQILALIRELQRGHGTGVLFITHDFGVVAEIADRVAVLRAGELVEIGPTDDLLAAPKHEYTRMLIAAVPSLVPKHRSVVTTPVVLADGQPVQDLRGARLVQPQARGGGGRGRDAGNKAGRNAGDRRRIGFGKVDRCALHRAPDRAVARAHRDRQHRFRIDLARGVARSTAPRADRVPGSVPLAQSAPDSGRGHRRRPDELRCIG